MLNLIFGIFIGIAVATVGFSGIASFLDKAVDQTKIVIKENVK
jgi:hypothetical protein